MRAAYSHWAASVLVIVTNRHHRRLQVLATKVQVVGNGTVNTRIVGSKDDSLFFGSRGGLGSRHCSVGGTRLGGRFHRIPSQLRQPECGNTGREFVGALFS
jgi:hypothetical protein